MGILPDYQIIHLAIVDHMINPFVPSKIRRVHNHPVLSYGTGHYGYDIRLTDEVLVARESAWPIDPKSPKPELQKAQHFQVAEIAKGDNGKFFVLPGNTFALGSTVEYFKMPPDVTGLVWGKSTYARWGVSVLCTPLEAGWEGNLTVEIANAGPDAVRVYISEGIAQIVFFQGEPCRVDYGKVESAYQGQKGLTLGSVK